MVSGTEPDTVPLPLLPPAARMVAERPRGRGRDPRVAWEATWHYLVAVETAAEGCMEVTAADRVVVAKRAAVLLRSSTEPWSPAGVCARVPVSWE